MEQITREQFETEMFNSWKSRVQANELKVNSQAFRKEQATWFAAMMTATKMLYGEFNSAVAINCITGREVTEELFKSK